MDKPIKTRHYRCSTSSTYNDFLRLIIENGFNVDIQTDCESLAILLTFGADDADAIQDVTNAIANMEIIISDYAIAPHESLVQALEEARGLIKSTKEDVLRLREERDEARNERDQCKDALRDRSCELGRVKGQIKAIATLLNTVFPEK